MSGLIFKEDLNHPAKKHFHGRDGAITKNDH
jgi:hypothetical protein